MKPNALPKEVTRWYHVEKTVNDDYMNPREYFYVSDDLEVIHYAIHDYDYKTGEPLECEYVKIEPTPIQKLALRVYFLEDFLKRSRY